MPCYYAKNDESLDLDNILEAIKQVKIHNASVRQAAIAHKISRATLGRYIAKFANIDVATANEDFMRNLLVESSKPGAKTVSFFHLKKSRDTGTYIIIPLLPFCFQKNKHRR